MAQCCSMDSTSSVFEILSYFVTIIEIQCIFECLEIKKNHQEIIIPYFVQAGCECPQNSLVAPDDSSGHPGGVSQGGARPRPRPSHRPTAAADAIPHPHRRSRRGRRSQQAAGRLSDSASFSLRLPNPMVPSEALLNPPGNPLNSSGNPLNSSGNLPLTPSELLLNPCGLPYNPPPYSET